MFGSLKGARDQLRMVQQLMQNEDFRAFISHPKVQQLFTDPEFQNLARGQNFNAMMSHPKFSKMMSDPEVAALVLKLKEAKSK